MGTALLTVQPLAAPAASRTRFGAAIGQSQAASVSQPSILHLFNPYRFFGGEEAAVLRMSAAMREHGAHVKECFCASGEWEQPGAPPKWQQVFRTLHNSDAIRRVREAHRSAASHLWLAHNIFPVLSAGVLREARRERVPIALYLHNYRPYSVSGSLWAGGRVAAGGLRKNFLGEVVGGAWQGSVTRSAGMALVLLAAHALGWYRRVDAWIAVSEFVRDRFIEAGVPREKIHVLAYPFVARDQPLQTTQRRQFAFLGRLTEAKGVRTLLAAWEQIRSKPGASIPRLVIAGEGELRREVELAVAASNGTIEFRGNVSGEQKDRLIAESQALIVPSLWWDPYPTVVYEAFDHARPVLAARSGGLPEGVAHGQRGLIHEPGDVAGLSAQVQELDRDQALAARLGANGREWLEANSGTELWWRGFEKIMAAIPKPARIHSPASAA